MILSTLKTVILQEWIFGGFVCWCLWTPYILLLMDLCHVDLYLVFVQCFMWLWRFHWNWFLLCNSEKLLPMILLFDPFFFRKNHSIYNSAGRLWCLRRVFLKKDGFSCLKHLIMYFSVMLLNRIVRGCSFCATFRLTYAVILTYFFCIIVLWAPVYYFISQVLCKMQSYKMMFHFSQSYWPYPIGCLLFIQVVNRVSFKHKTYIHIIWLFKNFFFSSCWFIYFGFSGCCFYLDMKIMRDLSTCLSSIFYISRESGW